MARPGDVRKHCAGWVEIIAHVDDKGQPTGGYLVEPGNEDIVEDVVAYIKKEEGAEEDKIIFCPGCGEAHKARIGVFTGFFCDCGWTAHVAIGMRRKGDPEAEIRAWKPLDEN